MSQQGNELRDQLSIETPELVSIEFPVAGVGSRALALFFDYLLQSAAIVVLFLLIIFFMPARGHSSGGGSQDGSQKWAIALVILTVFGLQWGYFTLFEAFWNGQTPGKRMARLRVIQETGRPVGFFESLGRNFVRVIDFLPAGYLVGAICIFATTAPTAAGRPGCGHAGGTRAEDRCPAMARQCRQNYYCGCTGSPGGAAIHAIPRSIACRRGCPPQRRRFGAHRELSGTASRFTARYPGSLGGKAGDTDERETATADFDGYDSRDFSRRAGTRYAVCSFCGAAKSGMTGTPPLVERRPSVPGDSGFDFADQRAVAQLLCLGGRLRDRSLTFHEGHTVQNASAILPAPLSGAESVSGKVLLVLAGTLFLAASSWLSVPTLPIPITMQTYAVIVVGAVFGARLGTAMVMAWLAEAAFGLPVLAHGTSGIAVFLGPTAGYLVSFPVAAAFVGWLADRNLDRSPVSSFLSMLGGNTINLALGVLWLSIAVGWRSAFVLGFLPFWIGGIAKAFLATATVLLVRRSRVRLPSDSQ